MEMNNRRLDNGKKLNVSEVRR